MNDIEALRSHLFNTLSALQDKENPMDIERAKAVCQVGDVIINSAKAEIDFARVNGSIDTQFFHKPSTVPQLAKHEEEVKDTVHRFPTKHGDVTVQGHITTHKLK